MRQQGVLTEWNDERGFGFITPDGGGERVFVHVSAFPRERRPGAGDQVSYDVGRDARNRLQASGVAYVGRTRSARTSTPGVRTSLVVVGVFFGVLVGLVAQDMAPALVLLAYVLLSAAAFVMYRADKVAAGKGSWRTPEANLHGIDLLGGWPGGLVARQLFRHKTRKQPFRTVFWLTVVANCGVLGYLVLEVWRG